MNRSIGEKQNGGNSQPRLWSKSILSNFMCRELPVLNLNEVEDYIIKKSPIIFRNNASCVTCHATMDPMASLLRNKFFTRSSNVDRHSTLHIGSYEASSKGAKAKKLNEEYRLPGKEDVNYYKGQAQGKFVYKNILGEVQEIELHSLNSLGFLVGNNFDTYYCTVKRIFSYLTGIEVSLYSLEEQWEDFSQKDKVLVADFLKLVKDFKDHQDLKKLYLDITNSKYFL